MAAQKYQAYLDSVTQCALECKACADACQAYSPSCAEIYRDCADLCWLCTAAFMQRGPHFIAVISRACNDFCYLCAKESEKHKGEAFRRCNIACWQVIKEYSSIMGAVVLERRQIEQQQNLVLQNYQRSNYQGYDLKHNLRVKPQVSQEALKQRSPNSHA